VSGIIVRNCRWTAVYSKSKYTGR